MQDGAEDQVRTILKFAVENGIYVRREHVYFDLGVRGHKSKRDGLDQLRQALRAKKVKVLLLFATNRLFRKVYRTLEFAEEVVNEYAIPRSSSNPVSTRPTKTNGRCCCTSGQSWMSSKSASGAGAHPPALKEYSWRDTSTGR